MEPLVQDGKPIRKLFGTTMSVTLPKKAFLLFSSVTLGGLPVKKDLDWMLKEMVAPHEHPISTRDKRLSPKP
jgi:hypothetical protein